MRDINRQVRGNAIAQSGDTHYHAQLGLDPDKGSAIKELDIKRHLALISYSSWLLDLTLKCHGQQPGPYELIDRFSTMRVGPSETDGSNR